MPRPRQPPSRSSRTHRAAWRNNAAVSMLHLVRIPAESSASGGGPMHGFKGERVLMRVHVGERDKYQGKPLYQQIVELLRGRHYAGATVFRGIMSFGASSRLHTDRF